MQVFTNQSGELVAVGSMNHAEWARLQAAHKRKGSPKVDAKADTPKVDPASVARPDDDEAKAQNADAKAAAEAKAAVSKPTPPKPATKT